MATTFVVEQVKQHKIAAYPAPGSSAFTGGLYNCCAAGCCACISKTCYMSMCPCLFYGGLFSKAGEAWLLGCCSMGTGLGMVRTAVRRHYGIAPDGCPDVGCGSDCMTVACCGTCAAMQMDIHLDRMAAEGAAMSTGVPK